MISIAKNLVLTVFALGFAPLTLRSYCKNPASQVTMDGRRSVVGKGLLSMARGHVLITHCDIGPDRVRTTPLAGEVKSLQVKFG
jgi:hypothetical protein